MTPTEETDLEAPETPPASMASTINIAVLESLREPFPIPQVVSPERLEYGHIAGAIYLVVKLFNTDKARRQLALLGLHFDNVKNDAKTFEGKITKIRTCVNDFVHQIQREFPPITVDYNMGDDCMACQNRSSRAGSFNSRSSYFDFNGKVGLLVHSREKFLLGHSSSPI